MVETCTIRMLFGGDFAPRGDYGSCIAANGGGIFGDARRLIAEADFTLFNLEVPLCRKLAGILKSGPVIHAAPETLSALRDAGVDAVCLANNHIFDHGTDGLLQTLAALETYEIRHVGAGLDRDAAEAPLRTVVKGRRISIFSFAEREFNLSDDGQAGAAILDPLRVTPLILRERCQSDSVIVVFHGGNEYFPYPRPGLRRLCQFLIEIGADAVIGHHPHVPGAYEIFRGRPIVYSLGNLVFEKKPPPPEWDKGYLVNLEMSFGADRLENIGLRLIPFRQSVALGGVKLMEGEKRSAFIERIERMRDHLENQPDSWLAAWDEFVANKQAERFIDMFSPIHFPGSRRLMGTRLAQSLIAPLVRKLIAHQTRHLRRLNMLRCPSHHELLVASLEAPSKASSKSAVVQGGQLSFHPANGPTSSSSSQIGDDHS